MRFVVSINHRGASSSDKNICFARGENAFSLCMKDAFLSLYFMHSNFSNLHQYLNTQKKEREKKIAAWYEIHA